MSFEDNYGQKAYDLILRAKLSLQMGKLLPYDGPLVRLVIQEQHDLNRKLRTMEAEGVTTSTHERWPALVILIRVVHQNKRCLLAYHSHRLGVIRTVYWEAGGAIAHVLALHRDDMSTDEVQYLHGFHDSVIQYRDALSPTNAMDLTMGVEDAPKESLLITVEAVIEPGPLYLESGLMDFKVGHRYVLLKHEVEHLILLGYLHEV
ncbi:Dna replication complex gins protein psf1 [Mycena sanguinolenta]|uniref:DNA replication complex GINS protein PSF1 n=1 Tax=Mycena sanguinolenta TaxID=230812 RepID=A0A8H6WT91_9AGAR|nr:Dna replication complex gins protein psf1 [Mycena sanguinolenta]